MSEQFVYTTPLDPRARPLLEGLALEYDSRYGDVLREPGEPREIDRYPAELFAPPHGNFVLLLRDGVAVGGGAFMRHDARTAELKRVWTHSRPAAPGPGEQGAAGAGGAGAAPGLRAHLPDDRLSPARGRGPVPAATATPRCSTPAADPETPRKLPFEKHLALARVQGLPAARHAEAVQR
jgi:hypothetical protein